jgi:hypothetical protein
VGNAPAIASTGIIWRLTLAAGVLLLAGGLSRALWRGSARPMAPGEARDGSPHDLHRRFERLYGLYEGETLRLLPPPYPPERAAHFALYRIKGTSRGVRPEAWTAWLEWNGPSHRTSAWNDEIGDVRAGVSACRPSLFIDQHVEIDESLLSVQVAGDWITAGGAPLATRLQVLQQILRLKLGRPIIVSSRDDVSEEIGVSGRLAPGLKDGQVVELYSKRRELERAEFAAQDLLGVLEQLTGLNTVYEADLGDIYPSSRIHPDAKVRGDRALIDVLLANVAKQTGLKLARQKRVETVIIVREGT